jgi:hypothetical protein
MIHDKDMAARLLHMITSPTDELVDSIEEVRQRCSEDEFKAYSKGPAYVVGYAYTDLMVPIYEEHPELKPPEAK